MSGPAPYDLDAIDPEDVYIKVGGREGPWSEPVALAELDRVALKRTRELLGDDFLRGICP